MATTVFEEDETPLVLASPPASTAVSEDDYDFEFGDASVAKLVGELDKLPAPTKDNPLRVALLTNIVKAKRRWSHFVDINGKKMMFKCLSAHDKDNRVIQQGICCKALNKDDKQKAKLNFAVLVAHYTNTNFSSYPKGGYPSVKDKPDFVMDVQVRSLRLSRWAYKTISDLMTEDEQAHEFDFLIAKSEKVGYDYGKLTKTAPRYSIDAALTERLFKEAADVDVTQLLQLLGKVLTEIEVKALLAGGRTPDVTTIDSTENL